MAAGYVEMQHLQRLQAAEHARCLTQCKRTGEALERLGIATALKTQGCLEFEQPGAVTSERVLISGESIDQCIGLIQ